MFSKSNDAASLSASNSSVDWECDAESRSWSSSASWSDDVESEATSRLWQQLQDIESVLYGEASPKTLPLPLRQEVAQWRATFPHLRVCGTKPPMGLPPTEPEEGEEEVYASHGEVSEDLKSKSNQKELQEQLKHQVMHKLFNKVKSELDSCSLTKFVKDSPVPVLSVVHQREPLLAHRQSARKESVKDTLRKPPASHETEWGSILRVSPLPKRILHSRANAHSSRSSVVLPPIEPLKSSASTMPLAVLGRQTRLAQPKTKVAR